MNPEQLRQPEHVRQLHGLRERLAAVKTEVGRCLEKLESILVAAPSDPPHLAVKKTKDVLVRPTAVALALHVLHYPDELRACPVRERSANGQAVTTEELQLAGTLIDAASGTPNWAAYRDQRADELRSLIEAKIAGQQSGDPEPAGVSLSLMDALKQSVAAAVQLADAPPRLAKTLRKRGRRTA